MINDSIRVSVSGLNHVQLPITVSCQQFVNNNLVNSLITKILYETISLQ